jgi:hypothetical protein
LEYGGTQRKELNGSSAGDALNDPLVAANAKIWPILAFTWRPTPLAAFEA